MGAVLILMACTNQQPADKAEQLTAETARQQPADKTPQFVTDSAQQPLKKINNVIVSINNDPLNAVYQHYLKLSTAITEGDVTAAKVSAAAIETGAQHVTSGKILAETAKKIMKAKDIDSQRAIYARLSNNFIILVKKSGLASGELYIQHCPMALSDQGANWLSSNQEIRNPYFGHQMLTCGSVQKKIKAGKISQNPDETGEKL